MKIVIGIIVISIVAYFGAYYSVKAFAEYTLKTTDTADYKTSEYIKEIK